MLVLLFIKLVFAADGDHDGEPQHQNVAETRSCDHVVGARSQLTHPQHSSSSKAQGVTEEDGAERHGSCAVRLSVLEMSERLHPQTLVNKAA